MVRGREPKPQACRVHRGVLAKNSEVFRGTLEMKQPEGADMVSDCLAVYLPDSCDDVHYFLSALYDRTQVHP